MSYKSIKEKLLEKTFEVSKDAIDLMKNLPRDQTNQILKKQFLRAVTSIGANYREAIEAESKKDFIHKLYLSKKEAREAFYWIGLIIHQNKKQKNGLKKITQEIDGLFRIFSSSIKTSKKKS